MSALPKLHQFDPVSRLDRREAYQRLEVTGEMQEAIWEALAKLDEQGIDLGPKFTEVSAKRSHIKKTAIKIPP